MDLFIAGMLIAKGKQRRKPDLTAFSALCIGGALLVNN